MTSHPLQTTLRLLPVLLLALGLAACSSSRDAPATGGQASAGAGGGRGIYKVGTPYQINGVWYYPAEDYTYDETGIASWYGPNFHGKITANGEDYDMNTLTAAHRTLPMPSFVRITNLDNGRSIVARINDRGPYARGRILDLSRRGAQLLGYLETGTARVRVQVLAEESRQIASAMQSGGPLPATPVLAETRPGEAPPVAAPRGEVASAPLAPPPGASAPPPPRPTIAALPAPPAAFGAIPPAPVALATKLPDPTGELPQQAPRRTQVYVQAGAFANRENAQRLGQILGNFGRPQITQVAVNGKQFYRVRLGPLASVEEGDRVLDQVVNGGHPEARLIVD